MLPLLAEHAAAARAGLPAEVWDYYAAGAGDELTLAEADASWSAYRIRPHVLRDVSTVDMSTLLLGTAVSGPIGVAPTAYHGLAHPQAEVATAAAAAAAGALFVLSTRSSCRIEDVAAAAGAWWFQAYVTRDRGVIGALVERASEAGARAIVLTGDTPYVGRKYRSATPPVTDEHLYVNAGEHITTSGPRAAAVEQDPSATLDAIGWLAELSGLPVVVKGVLRGDDARDCVRAGARAVVVSTHGGRQTDRAVSSASALPEVADAVGADVEVYADGGIRSGADALVALASGARAVFVGRPVLYALAAGGGAAVQATLAGLGDDLARTLAVAGFRAAGEPGPDDVRPA